MSSTVPSETSPNELYLDILTKNKDNNRPFTYSDGLAGALIPVARLFVTSSNCPYIHTPPISSTRDLYRRADACYGIDDPIQHPQPLNKQWPFLPCIPVQPQHESEPYYNCFALWSLLTADSLEYTEMGKARGEGVLKELHVEPLSFCMTMVRARTSSFRAKYTDGKYQSYMDLLLRLQEVIDVCWTRLRHVSASLRDQTRGLAELQRALLMSLAATDYIEIFLPRLLGQQPPAQEVACTIGAFVWNDDDARALFNAGLRVWYVRPYSAFDRQIIRKAVTPLVSQLCNDTANPPYPVVYTGQAGSDDKFATIWTEMRNVFRDANPFSNLHIPGAYQSSFHLGSGSLQSPVASATVTMGARDTRRVSSASSFLGPVRNDRSGSKSFKSPYERPICSKSLAEPTKNSSQDHRNLFCDLPKDDALTPEPIKAWQNAKANIKRAPSSKQTPKLFTILPDPLLFFSSSDLQRQRNMFLQWMHVQGPLLTYYRQLSNLPPPRSTSFWRKVLALKSKGLEKREPGEVTKNKQAEEAREVEELLHEAFGTGQSIVNMSDQTIEATDTRPLLHTLSLINFRYQLVCLDRSLDSSRPRPLPLQTQAQFNMAQVDHEHRRAQLISDIFGGGGDIFTLTSHQSNLGVTSTTWASRLVALKSFWRLMESWPVPKELVWARGADPNLVNMQGAGEEWENVLIRYYVQSYYDHFGYPPILPTRI